MKVGAYFKRTGVGTFWIRPFERQWGLFVEHHGDMEYLGSYDSPEAAADDVYTQHTGWDAWDGPDRPEAPADLGEWEFQNLA